MSWHNLSEMDLQFARSRRRATTRRRLPPKRKPMAWRSVRAGALALVLLAVVAESTRLETSNAKPPAQRAVAAPAIAATCPVPKPFRAAFATASAKTGVPLSLLVATAYEESRMDPNAHSGAGATGPAAADARDRARAAAGRRATRRRTCSRARATCGR